MYIRDMPVYRLPVHEHYAVDLCDVACWSVDVQPCQERYSSHSVESQAGDIERDVPGQERHILVGTEATRTLIAIQEAAG